MPTKQTIHGLAAVAMLGILGGIVVLQKFSKLEAETQGPSVIATNEAGDVLLGARHLLFLVPSGKPVERIELEALGLGGPVVGLGWDGKDWFVADDASGTLHRCDLAAKSCRPALAVSEERWLRRTAKLAFAPDRIFVTDTERHRLLAFGAGGDPVGSSRTAPIALCFPNGIRAYDGGLLVADTNNHRIAWVDPTADFASETYLHVAGSPEVTKAQCSDASLALGERGDPALNTLVDSAAGGLSFAIEGARPGRTWPTAVQPVTTTIGPNYWVIVADSGMRDGDVLVFSDGSDLPKVIGLPDDADPVELAQLGDKVLITDPTRMRVYASSIETAAHVDSPLAADWDATGVSAVFNAQRSQRATYKALRFAATGGIGLGVLLALVVVVLERKREQAEKGA